MNKMGRSFNPTFILLILLILSITSPPVLIKDD